MHDCQVLIAGAGPVGLSLGLSLARNGVGVIVLEKNPGTAEHSRAPAIWPGTQEILAGLGVIDDFLGEGIIMRRLEILDVDRGECLLKAPLEELADETAWPQLLILPQSRTEALLLHALKQQPGAKVLFSSEVTSLVQSADGVEVQFRDGAGVSRLSADFLAGCDGAHSTIRKLIEAGFDGITYRVRAALADVALERDAGIHSPRVTTRPRPAIGIRIADKLWRLILPFREQSRIPLARHAAEAAESLFPPGPRRQVWQSEFSLHRRASTAFARGRVVLAGDAAHLNSPVGGQGMNAGIQDAAVLGAALLEALERDDPAPLLDYGVSRRRGIEQGVNRFTDRLTRLLLVKNGALIRPMLGTADTAMTVPFLRRRILRRLAMLDGSSGG